MAATLEGVPQLVAQLRSMGKAVTGTALRAAVRAGSKPIIAKAKENIPVGSEAHRTYKGRLVAPGFAQRNIAAKTYVARDKEGATAVVGVKKEAFYAVNFVEVSKGKSKLTGRPWLEPAFESTQRAQQDAISKGLSRALQSAIRKAAK